MMRATFEHIASALSGALNCAKIASGESKGHHESVVENARHWHGRHISTIVDICRNHMPSGGGIDSGTTFDFERSTMDRLVFNTSYHHMNDGGVYDGWTEHTVTVRPSFISRFDVTVSGRNRNDIKDYLADTFRCALDAQWDNAPAAEQISA